MQTFQRLACIALIALIGAVLARSVVPAIEESAITLSFNPQEDASSRYMFQMAMRGVQISPGVKDEMAFGEFLIGTVYKDTCTASLHGLNRHAINFYEYNVRELQTPLGTDINDPRFGGSPWPPIPQPGGEGGGGGGGETPPGGGGGGGGETPPGGGGGGGGAGGGSSPQGTGGGSGFVGPMKSNGFVSSLDLPVAGPLQGRGGGGGETPPGGGGGNNGGSAGANPSSINLDTILVTNLNYVTNKQGEVLDVGGLDMLRKVSKNRLVTETDDKNKSYIDINISHVFEWSHLLYLPTNPVYKEDIWYHSFPIHVPGLPMEQPILTKFMYKLVDFREVGSRKVAVIDTTGIAEFNTEWDERTTDQLTEFKSWGTMGFAARYWFDYEKGMIFGIERPPFYDYQYARFFEPIEVGMPYDGQFQLSYPGLVVNLEMFYNTNITDVSNKPKLQKEPPKELRRYINLNMLCQLEAE